MDKYAVIGNPVEHSKSPEIHAMFAEQCQQDIVYERILSNEASFKTDVDKFFETASGLNVTVPFKLLAKNYADQVSERAEFAGAANTLIKNNNKIIADNTDGLGLVRDITENHQQNLKKSSVLIIGAGGASRGVIGPLFDAGIQELIIANRTLSKAETLVKTFEQKGSMQAIALENIKGISGVDVIINASSAGLSGETAPLPENLSHSFCYDMIYSAKDTAFISLAQQKGCQYFADGLGMLVEQAAESFYLWRGVRPKTKRVIEKLRSEL